MRRPPLGSTPSPSSGDGAQGADISGVAGPVPFSLLLADHRAGDDSLFVHPRCE